MSKQGKPISVVDWPSVGAAASDAPLSRPTEHADSQVDYKDDNIPIGLPRTVKKSATCGAEVNKKVNAIGHTEGERHKVKIGIDSCAAVSCAPKGLFPGDTSQVGVHTPTVRSVIHCALLTTRMHDTSPYHVHYFSMYHIHHTFTIV